MDNYTLNEVKMLIDKKMMKPEILKNILKSTTRRIELYDDEDDLEILKYLANNEAIPKKTKEEIDKYLKEYEKFNKDKDEINIEKKDIIYKKKLIVYSVILIILLLTIITLTILLLTKGNSGV